MSKLLSTLLLCFLILAAAAEAQQPVRIIYDTDMDTDVDDAGALAMLHALADNGEAKILATITSSPYPWSGSAIAVINHHYGRDHVPIGAPKGADVVTLGRPFRYAREISEEFPHPRVRTNDDVEDAVSVYRRVLASQPDSSVVIASVGYVTNLRDLLRSGPDEFSPLNGHDLVARKVSQWVCMGSGYPGLFIRHGNFNRHPEPAREAARDWPTRIVFTGLGDDVHTGFLLRVLTPPENPVRRAYEHFLRRSPTRPSWDQVAVLYAVRGTGEFFRYLERGYNHIFEDGTSEWRFEPDRENHISLLLEAEPSAVAHVIDELMAQHPANRRRVQPIEALSSYERSPGYFAVDGEPAFLIGGRVRLTQADYLQHLERLGGLIEEIGSPHVRGLVQVRRGEVRSEQQLREYLEAARRQGVVVAFDDAPAIASEYPNVLVNTPVDSMVGEGAAELWRSFLSGAASAQVAASSTGVTSAELAALRNLGRFVATTHFWRMSPDPSVVISSPAEQVRALSNPWDEYVVELSGGGAGELVIQVDPGSYWLRWYDRATGAFSAAERAEGTRLDIDHAGPLRLSVPAYGQSLIMHLRKL